MSSWLVLFLLAAGDATAEAQPGAKAMFDSSISGTVRFSSEPRVQSSDRSPETAPRSGEGRRSANSEMNVPHRPLGIRYWIQQLNDRGAPLGRVAVEHLFREGDRIQLVMESNEDGFVAVVQEGSDGKIGLLYPQTREQLGAGKLTARSQFLLPDGRHSFTFDDKPGQIQLWVVVAGKPADLAALPLAQEMSASDLDALREFAARERGCKNLVIEAFEDPQTGPATYSVHRGGGTIVQEIRLAHR